MSTRTDHRANLRYIVQSLLIQLVAYLVMPFFADRYPGMPLGVLLLAHSGLGFAAAHFWGQPLPWKILNTAIPWTVILASSAPQSLWLALAALSGILFLPAIFTRVPYFPSGSRMIAEVAKLLPADKPFVFVDLGCGFGGTLVALAAERPLGQFIGIELSPLCYLVAKARSMLAGRERITVRYAGIFSYPLADADVLYAFLSPAPMEQLWDHVRQSAKSGSLFVVNTFALEREQPTFTVEVHDGRSEVLYGYKVP